MNLFEQATSMSGDMRDVHLLVDGGLLRAPYSGDSDTSRQAAESIPGDVIQSQCLAVLRSLRRAGHRGATREELADATGLEKQRIEARAVPMGEAGLCWKLTDVRRKGRAGRDLEVLIHDDFRDGRDVDPWDSPMKRLRRKMGRVRATLAGDDWYDPTERVRQAMNIIDTE
jgi:hypothetical protein